MKIIRKSKLTFFKNLSAREAIPEELVIKIPENLYEQVLLFINKNRHTFFNGLESSSLNQICINDLKLVEK